MHGIFGTAYGLVSSLNLMDELALPRFSSISSFSLQFRVASLLEAQIMTWLLDGNLRTVKFENMDIWDQLQGLVYQTVNVDTYNLIK